MVTASVSTFVFVASLWTSMKSIQTPLSSKAANRFECGVACNQIEECGGIVWDGKAVPRCKLVSMQGGGPNVNGKVYRKLTFRGQKLIELRTEIDNEISIRNVFDACSAIGTVPVPIPLTVQEKTVLQIRSKLRVALGVIRDPNSPIFRDFAGGVYNTSDTSLYTWDMQWRDNRIYGNYLIQKGHQLRDYDVNSPLVMVVKYCLTED